VALLHRSSGGQQHKYDVHHIFIQKTAGISAGGGGELFQRSCAQCLGQLAAIASAGEHGRTDQRHTAVPSPRHQYDNNHILI